MVNSTWPGFEPSSRRTLMNRSRLSSKSGWARALPAAGRRRVVRTSKLLANPMGGSFGNECPPLSLLYNVPAAPGAAWSVVGDDLFNRQPLAFSAREMASEWRETL